METKRYSILKRGKREKMREEIIREEAGFKENRPERKKVEGVAFLSCLTGWVTGL